MSINAESEYSSQLDDAQRHLVSLRGRDRSLSRWRLIVFFAGVAVTAAVIRSETLSGWWTVLPAATFVFLAVLHRRVARLIGSFERQRDYYHDGVERLNGRWVGRGTTGERFLEPGHPYASDLDIYGKGSLFELICRARTVAGETKLASWLNHPSDVEAVSARQVAVRELRELHEFRRDLASLGIDLRNNLDPARLSSWVGAPHVAFGRAERVFAAVLSVLGVGALILAVPEAVTAIVGTTHPDSVALSSVRAFASLPLLIVIIVDLLFWQRVRSRVHEVISGVEQAAFDLSLISTLVARIEIEQFSSPQLQRLMNSVRTEERTSESIDRLSRLVVLLDSRRNQFFLPFAALLLWTYHLAAGIERWRERTGRAMVNWLDVIAELEALSSLATFSWERDDAVFPSLSERGPLFDADGLGHPLITPGSVVRNDVTLTATRRLLIVSGSNMSGKSTLLRAVGVNAVLALAGAPVIARRLGISSFVIGASIQIRDSLLEGSSHFYAEITRLRDIVSLTRGQAPVLFLVDEILHGTNSHDRRIGAEAVVRTLVEKDAVGLVTTHDLALTRIVGELGEIAENVHFEDHLEAGQMRFDYRMRPGVVEKSNAIELMRAVGLDV